MNPVEIISIVESLGAEIQLHGDQLKIVNGQQLPLETINLLKQHKPDLLAYLVAGDAPIIEQLDQSNDAPVLSGLQQRAFNGFVYLMDKAKQNLARNAYPIDNAMVRREQWRDAVMRTLHLNRERMDEIETALYLFGAIDYVASRLYIVAGDGLTKVNRQLYKDNPDFILSDDTGVTFCGWLFH